MDHIAGGSGNRYGGNFRRCFIFHIGTDVQILTAVFRRPGRNGVIGRRHCLRHCGNVQPVLPHQFRHQLHTDVLIIPAGNFEIGHIADLFQLRLHSFLHIAQHIYAFFLRIHRQSHYILRIHIHRNDRRIVRIIRQASLDTLHCFLHINKGIVHIRSIFKRKHNHRHIFHRRGINIFQTCKSPQFIFYLLGHKPFHILRPRLRIGGYHKHNRHIHIRNQLQIHSHNRTDSEYNQ